MYQQALMRFLVKKNVYTYLLDSNDLTIDINEFNLEIVLYTCYILFFHFPCYISQKVGNYMYCKSITKYVVYYLLDIS